MRASELFARTLREAPAGEEAPSARLLLRAAMVRRVMSGVYTFLPLGLRTLRKVEAIVREEMNRTGAQELLMPALQPSDPWKLTGRWDAYGDDMFKLTDRGGREIGLAPTHEECITPIVQGDFRSYRDLPVNLYQIQWKYRDEPRPRSGVIRGREFLMKDAYSFDRDAEGLRVSYAKMVDAYTRIFDRCGLEYRVVEADPGLIGGDVNHEFMALANIGEDLFVSCTNCDYAANLETAQSRPAEPSTAELEPLEEVSTPGRTTVDAVADLLGLSAERILKCLIYRAGKDLVAVLVPGNREVAPGKLARVFAPDPVDMLADEEFEQVGLIKGFVGPQGLEGVTIVADHHVRSGANWVTGANRPDAHATGVNLDRDCRVDRFEDVSLVLEGDACPRCDAGTLRVGRAIEVGHTFQLGTRYSEPLSATFVDEDGENRFYVMGCYGIGVSRIVAAVAEQHHDESGLAWPVELAPADVVIIPTNMDQDRVVETAEAIYRRLEDRVPASVIDDREVGAGVKFADADLVGYPVQVIVGQRGLQRGVVEGKIRATGERRDLPLDRAGDAALELLAEAP
ncbi:MAG: proline--tRNA ligase [Actinomycetota bacterium]